MNLQINKQIITIENEKRHFLPISINNKARTKDCENGESEKQFYW